MGEGPAFATRGLSKACAQGFLPVPDVAAARRVDRVVCPGRQVEFLVLEVETLVVAGVELFDLRNVGSREPVRATSPLGVHPSDSCKHTDKSDHDQ